MQKIHELTIRGFYHPHNVPTGRSNTWSLLHLPHYNNLYAILLLSTTLFQFSRVRLLLLSYAVCLCNEITLADNQEWVPSLQFWQVVSIVEWASVYRPSMSWSPLHQLMSPNVSIFQASNVRPGDNDEY